MHSAKKELNIYYGLCYGILTRIWALAEVYVLMCLTSLVIYILGMVLLVNFPIS